MIRLSKMLFEILAASVNHISTDFTGIFLAETVEFIQPEGDWFAIPAKREFEGVVNEVVAWSVLFIVISGFGGGIQGFVL
jgi:hypothetical protein